MASPLLVNAAAGRIAAAEGNTAAAAGGDRAEVFAHGPAAVGQRGLHFALVTVCPAMFSCRKVALTAASARSACFRLGFFRQLLPHPRKQRRLFRRRIRGGLLCGHDSQFTDLHENPPSNNGYSDDDPFFLLQTIAGKAETMLKTACPKCKRTVNSRIFSFLSEKRISIMASLRNERSAPKKIPVIEDDKLLSDSVCDGESGAEYTESGICDLLIPDVMMPELNGYQVAREVRAKRCTTPLLMLTAKSGREGRIEGLNAGADYYLTKSFDSRELLACVNALLRRQGTQVDELCCGSTALDLSSCTLLCGEVILARVWGYDSNAVENHVTASTVSSSSCRAMGDGSVRRRSVTCRELYSRERDA